MKKSSAKMKIEGQTNNSIRPKFSIKRFLRYTPIIEMGYGKGMENSLAQRHLRTPYSSLCHPRVVPLLPPLSISLSDPRKFLAPQFVSFAWNVLRFGDFRGRKIRAASHLSARYASSLMHICISIYA